LAILSPFDFFGRGKEEEEEGKKNKEEETVGFVNRVKGERGKGGMENERKKNIRDKKQLFLHRKV
jgi:hypothetical protein